MQYTFDDYTIVPAPMSRVRSRYASEINLLSELGDRNYFPLVSSNMRTVTGRLLAEVMHEEWAIGILPRVEFIHDTINSIKESDLSYHISIGLNDCSYKIFCDLITNHPERIRSVTVEVANAANDHVFEYVKDKVLPLCATRMIPVIVGNICTASAAALYSNLNIEALKIGVGSGASCTTRLMTGVGVSQITAIQNVAQVLEERRTNSRRGSSKIKLIADGGISKPADYVKAIVAGADFVMMGKVFAYAKESPGWTNSAPSNADGIPYDLLISATNKWTKQYTGESTFATNRHPEGISNQLKLDREPPSAKDIIRFYNHGLRSAMSYCDAYNLDEFRKNAKLELISYASVIEARTSSEAMLP